MKKEMNLFEIEEKIARKFLNNILLNDDLLFDKINFFNDKDSFIKILIFEISQRFGVDSNIEDIKWFVKLAVKSHN